jgi:hypothetical protein
MEKTLQFKNMSIEEISNDLIKMNPESLRKLMISYSNYLSKVLNKYKKTTINEIVEVMNARKCKLSIRATNETLKLIHKIDKKYVKMKENEKLSKKSIIKQIMNYFYPIPEKSVLTKSTSSVFSEVTPGSVYSLEIDKKDKEPSAKKTADKEKTLSSKMQVEFG